MAGMFELFVDAQSRVRFRLKGPDGVIAVSRAFEDKPAAIAGIAAMREYAGMGHIADLCFPKRSNPVPARPAAVPPPEESAPVQGPKLRTNTRAFSRTPAGVRRTSAA